MVVHGGTHSGGPVRLFQQGLPETRNFPIRIWERLERQVLKEHGTAALVMTDPQGALERPGAAGAVVGPHALNCAAVCCWVSGPFKNVGEAGKTRRYVSNSLRLVKTAEEAEFTCCK